MQPNLNRNPPPAAAIRTAAYILPRAATCGLVFSLTVATTLTEVELYKRVNLAALPLAGPNTTTSASVIGEAPLVQLASNPLDALIDEIHADIPDEVWARLPTIHAADIDKHVYGT